MKKMLIIMSFFMLLSMNVRTIFADIEEDLGTIVITASRTAQHGYKVAGNVTVLTADQIAASNAQTLPDVLKEALGVFTYDFNTIKTAVLDIRGFGDTASRNVLVLVNDRRINSVDMSGPDLLQIPLDAIERVEIIRGAGSVLYGDNAVGGVVNIITKKGEGDLSGKLNAFYGSYDTQGTGLQLSGEFKDISYFFHSKYHDSRGYRDKADVLTKDFNTRLNYKVSERLTLDLDLGVHDDTNDLPGGLDEAELASLGRRGSANPSDVATTTDKYYKMSFDLNPWPEDVYFGDFVFDVSQRDRDVFDSFTGFNTDRRIDTLGITSKYIFDRTIFDKEVNFVTGIDYYDTENNIRGSGFNTDDLTITKKDFGIYGFLEYELIDKFFVNAGTRYYRAEYTFDQRASTVTLEKTKPKEWVSMGGAKYEYGRGSNIHFNVQQTFRFLATDEWYSTFSGLNTALKQQTGLQAEVGIRHNFRNNVMMTVTPYWIQNKNEIFFDPTQGFFGSNSNYDKIQRIGVEVGNKIDLHKFFAADLLDKLEFFSNYTYQQAKFLDGANDGKKVPLVPNHQTTVGVVKRLFDYFNVSLTGHHVGSRFIINDTTNAMPRAKPYYVLDGKLAFDHKDIEIYVGINNMLDEKYAPYQIRKTATSRDIYPAPTRNFIYGVNLKF